MAICDRHYCDFVCWTPMGMHIEQIQRNQPFFREMKVKLDSYFVKVVLPAVLTNSMDPKPELEKENSPPANVYCYCRKEEFGDMIACDNTECAYQWFHFSCVGVTHAPGEDEPWFCPDCKLTLRK